MKQIILILTILFLSACAPAGQEDPLKNTKKLAIKGHTSLYNNGMFAIPFTTVNFIPSATTSIVLVQKLFFEDAREALVQGVKDALDSVYIIPEGSKRAYELSKDVYRVSDELSDDIRKFTRGDGVWLIKRSSQIAQEHILGSLSSAKKAGEATYALGDQMESYLDTLSSKFIDTHLNRSQKIFSGSIKAASQINDTSARWAGEHFDLGTESFITGYVTLPSKLADHLDAMGESVSDAGFGQAIDNAETFRSKNSAYFSDIIADTFTNYTDNVGESLSKVTEDFGKHVEEEGVILSSLKSMRWLLQAIFYDGLIEPLTNLTIGSIGLVSINGVIYPIHLAAGETKAAASVVVEVTLHTAQSLYEIVAPSITFALASILSTGEYVGGKALSATTATAGSVASAVDATAGIALAATTKTAGLVLGKSTKYVAVPLAVSATAVGEIGYGVIGSSSAMAAGSTLLASGEVAGVAAQATGATLSATTLVAGSTYSVADAAVEGLYHLSEAVLLPAGYTLASGTVLGYGSLSQLQMHTILAASDAVYMVLSLEGPKWVLYSLSGSKLKESKPLPAGAIIDLQKVDQNSTEIKRVPVSDQEIEAILSHIQKDLPQEK